MSRLHLQLISVLRAPGKLKYLAGSESGVGGVGQRRPAGAGRGPAARGGHAVSGPSGRRDLRRALRVAAGRRVVGPRAGQPHRRAHRLQRAASACRWPCRTAPRWRPGSGRTARCGSGRCSPASWSPSTSTRSRRAPLRLGGLRRGRLLGAGAGRPPGRRRRPRRGRPGAAGRGPVQLGRARVRGGGGAVATCAASGWRDDDASRDLARRDLLPRRERHRRRAHRRHGPVGVAALHRRPRASGSTAATARSSRCRSTWPRTASRCW